MTNSIDNIRTNWQIIEGTTGFKGEKFMCIAGPHHKSSISELTMGKYQNYTHTEIKPVVFKDGHIRLHINTVHNNHVSTGGCSIPYTTNGKIYGVNETEQQQVSELITHFLTLNEVK